MVLNHQQLCLTPNIVILKSGMTLKNIALLVYVNEVCFLGNFRLKIEFSEIVILGVAFTLKIFPNFARRFKTS